MAQPRPLDPRQTCSMRHANPPFHPESQYLPPQHHRHGQDARHRHSLIPSGSNDSDTLLGNYDMDPRQHTRQIDETLNLQCGIDGKFYFVITLTEDWSVNTYFSPGQPLPQAFIRQFFNEVKFRQIMKNFANVDQDLDAPFDTVGSKTMTMYKQQSSAFEEASTPSKQGKKRARALQNEEMAINSILSKPIAIGEADAVWDYYQEQFRNCQQTACKLIAKAWVKAAEPKKQSAHPYTGKVVPTWWPKPWGPSQEYAVRHKEPDHLYKRERIHLLAHILRLAIKPRDKQHPDIQKLDLSVEKLNAAAFETLKPFFKENEANAKKRPFLSEIFRVASQEQKYESGEIEGTTQVIFLESQNTETYASSNDEQPLTKNENYYGTPMMRPSTTQGATQMSAEDGFAPITLAGPSMSDVSLRRPHFPPSVIGDDVSRHSHSFEDNKMLNHGQSVVRSAARNLRLDNITITQEISERPSIFSDCSGTPDHTLYNHRGPFNTAVPSMLPTYQNVTPQHNPQTYTQTTPRPSVFTIQSVKVDSTQSFETSLFEPVSGSGFGAWPLPLVPENPSRGYECASYVSLNERAICTARQGGVGPGKHIHQET